MTPYGYQPMMMPAPGMVPTYPPDVLYKGNVAVLPPQELARLGQHTLTRFPTAVVVLLHFVTFGLFSLIHFGLKHDQMPKAATDDPSAGKAIGFHFIPFYNWYWIFFQPLRLMDRLNLQMKVRGLQPTAPRGLVMTCCILGVIPYINLLAILILWPIAAGMTQATINKVASLPPQPAMMPGYAPPGYPQQPSY